MFVINLKQTASGCALFIFYVFNIKPSLYAMELYILNINENAVF